MKTAVIGIGAIGGFIGTLLAAKYDDVILVARGKRGEALKESGITLKSAIYGEVHAKPEIVFNASLLPECGMIFICVKNYSLDEVLKQMKPAVGPDTIIVPVMNGTDPGDRIREAFPDARVIDSLIYIVAFAEDDFVIHHTNQYARIKLGAPPGSGEKLNETADEVCAYLKGAGIDAEVSENIRLDIWRKYILNCAFNVCTARYNTSIGPIRSDERKAGDYCALVREAAAVGRALGVPILDDHVDTVIGMFYQYDARSSSSFQRDVMKGLPTEIETFSGYIVKTAASLGLKVPVSEEYYRALLDSGVK